MQLDGKKIIIIAVVLSIIITIVIIIAITVLPWLFIGVYSWLAPNPPKPEIIYGEFPFRITYELDGEIKVIEDIVVCEFDGFESHGEAGKCRKWKSYLKSGSERITLLKIDDTSEIYCIPELPEYYMGDLMYQTNEQYKKEQNRTRDSTTFIKLIKRGNETKAETTFISSIEAYEKYKIKLINWESSPPITNSFK